MDPSADGDGPVTVVVAALGEIEQSARRPVRRRLVQSTLFPHKSPEVVKSSGEKKKRDDEEGNGENNDVNDKDEDEDWGSSQGKKRKVARKGKASNSQPRTPKKSKRKGRSSANSTPKKNETINGIDLTEDRIATPPSVPNVRLEAKMADEEYSQKFAGKQLHPFFSLRKGSKKYVISDVLRGSSQSTAPPIHVFERDEGDVASLDWRHWELNEKPFLDSAWHTDFSSISVVDYNVSLEQHYSQGKDLLEDSAIVSTVSSDQNYKPDESRLCGGQVTGASVEKLGVLHEDRVIRYSLDGEIQSDNRLWTDKYQPKMASEVCSNTEAVTFVNEWLHSWHQKGDGVGKVCPVEVDSDEQDTDYCCSESDSENINEIGGPKPVLLVTGPAGSGKSAAIYACAKEQGYKILEVSTSDYRNGAVVRRKFGEALESQFFKRSLDSPVKSQGQYSAKFSFALPQSKVVQDLENKVIDLESVTDDPNSYGVTETCGNSISCDNATKSLILFEDVDVVFPEDAGFITAIQQIAENAKGPVILTSNSESPDIPDKLDRLCVNFKLPTNNDLLQHVYKVCSSEKSDSERHVIEQIVDCCHGDIRKAIMHVQFWCQGKQFRKTGTPRLLEPLIFCPETAHELLPEIIPSGCPSQLSELIEKEIMSSLSQSEESYLATRTSKETLEAVNGDLLTCGFGKDRTAAKKAAMLGRNGLEFDCNNLTALSAAHDAFNSSSSPVSFARKNSRRKLDHIVSSDSEDDTGIFLIRDKISSLDVSRQDYLSRAADFQTSSRAEKWKENCYQNSGIALDLHTDNICQSMDISCVPESTFVPETEIDDGTRASVDKVNGTFEEVSVTNGFDLNISPVEENLDDWVSESYGGSEFLGNTCNGGSEFLGNTCNLQSTSSQQEIEDDLNGIVAREYQVMDECSRIDFNMQCQIVEELGPFDTTDAVRETWRKLRHRHADLRQLVALEDKNASETLRIAHGMSNLVSEAEILLSKCQLPDSSGLFMALSEVSDPFSRHDEQQEMTSAIVHHGFGCYVDDINGLRHEMGFQDSVNLTQRMLSTINMMKSDSSLMGQDPCGRVTSSDEPDRMPVLPDSGGLAKRENQSNILDIVHSIVPSRSYSAIKGEAFQDYLFALSHISRSEASRLSGQSTNVTRRRRTRASRHYLSTGSLSLSPDNISLLAKCNTYRNATDQN
ncbi:ATPase family AAA domain-containing protein 5 [Linum perenne]